MPVCDGAGCVRYRASISGLTVSVTNARYASPFPPRPCASATGLYSSSRVSPVLAIPDHDRVERLRQRVERAAEPPVAGETGRRIEQVLAILHVEHGKAARAGVVIGWEMDEQVALVAELRAGDVRQPDERARSNAPGSDEPTDLG